MSLDRILFSLVGPKTSNDCITLITRMMKEHLLNYLLQSDTFTINDLIVVYNSVL